MAIEPVGIADVGQVPLAGDVFVLSDRERDFEADRQIKECLASTSLVNKVITYSFDHRSWQIRLVYNPEGRVYKFENEAGGFGQKYALLTKDVIPKRLQQHLEELIEKQLGKTGHYISIASTTCLRGECLPDFDRYAVLNLVEPKAPIAPVQQANPPAAKVNLVAIKTEKFSSASDQEVRACFASPTFINAKIDYVFEGYAFQIRIVHNPERQQLWGDGFPGIMNVPFIITAEKALPFQLESHLKELALDHWKGATDFIMQVSRFRDYEYNIYANLRPMIINKDGALDADFDAQIMEAFTSQGIANIVLHYQIKDQNYKVRIIHNPEKEKLFAARYFDHVFLRKDVTLVFPYKYGILVDKEAPQELIDHLTKLMNVSWWDSLWNSFTSTFKIANGTCISFTEGNWRFTSEVSWCEFFSNLKSKETG